MALDWIASDSSSTRAFIRLIDTVLAEQHDEGAVTVATWLPVDQFL